MKLLSKVIFSALIICLLPNFSNPSNAFNLSEEADFYLLTATPGDELYSVFGHSAIWVYDQKTGIDYVYNYGTFDFRTPNFYLKFIRGKLHYMLSVSSIRGFEFAYRLDGRGVVKQKINLSYREKLQIFDFLEDNKKPENREYLYDFFYDNCATRIRDVFDKFVDIKWHEYPFDFDPKTYRELLKDYVMDMTWERFGIDIALGVPVDRKADVYDYMFLPDHMYVAFANAKRSDGEPLVLMEKTIVEETLETQKPGLFNPVVLFWFLFFVVFLALFFKRTRKYFAKTWIFILGLTGIALSPLYLFSDHAAFTPNLNLLWALPTHIFFVFKTTKQWGQKYFKYVCFLTIILLIFFPWLPQKFNPAIFPIMLTTLFCSTYLAYRNLKS